MGLLFGTAPVPPFGTAPFDYAEGRGSQAVLFVVVRCRPRPDRDHSAASRVYLGGYPCLSTPFPG